MQTQTSALQQQSTVYYNQHNLNCHNFIIRVKETMVWLKTKLFGMKEISDIIPEFNPNNIVYKLRNNWNGTKLCSCSLILAMQTKLEGNAKAWNDSLQSVFNRRCEFSAQLLANFAKYRNELNIHTEIMASQRLQGEKS